MAIGWVLNLYLYHEDWFSGPDPRLCCRVWYTVILMRWNNETMTRNTALTLYKTWMICRSWSCKKKKKKGRHTACLGHVSRHKNLGPPNISRQALVLLWSVVGSRYRLHVALISQS
jgi:hypothetical protein